MGIITLCVCHRCKEYVNLDKSLVCSWLSGGAIRCDDDDFQGWEEWEYIYEINDVQHSHRTEFHR